MPTATAVAAITDSTRTLGRLPPALPRKRASSIGHRVQWIRAPTAGIKQISQQAATDVRRRNQAGTADFAAYGLGEIWAARVPSALLGALLAAAALLGRCRLAPGLVLKARHHLGARAGYVGHYKAASPSPIGARPVAKMLPQKSPVSVRSMSALLVLDTRASTPSRSTNASLAEPPSVPKT